MSVATEFPPDVCIPAAARPRSLRSLRAVPDIGDVPGAQSARPAAPAAAAIGAEVFDLDRWRHQDVGAQAGGRRRNASGLRIRPEAERAAAAAHPPRDRRPCSGLGRGCPRRPGGCLAVGPRVGHVGHAGTAGSAGSSAVVTVHSGDSLWSIATEVAPDRDPRLEVAQLRQLNHLTGDTVSPGQQLRLR